MPPDAEARTPPKRAAVEWNALGVLLGRASANVEILLAQHHAFVGSLAYQGLGDVNGPIAEIGYRIYYGDNGLEGFFLGPSLVGGVLLYKPYGCYSSCSTRNTAIMTSIALDAGYQAILGDNVVLGAGLGIAYQHADRQVDYSAENLEIIFLGTGFIPRVLFSLGYAF